MKHLRMDHPRRCAELALLGLLCWLGAPASASVVFQPFHHFFGITGDNVNASSLTEPNPPLIQATDGNLYGTVAVGGTYGFGYVFRVTTNGVFSIVYSFSGGSDGGTPEAALVQASDGNFYGTTPDGGTDYDGTVFRLTTNGALTTLYSFTGGADGLQPETALVEAGDGNLYGAATGAPAQLGTFFRITRAGMLTPISAAYGGSAVASLTLGSDGNLYGTFSYGEVFRLTTNGNYSTLYTFPGDVPNGLARTGDGNLYGTTLGGAFFRVGTNGVLVILDTFPGTDGYPYTQLAVASDGGLYGATSGYTGEIYRITTSAVATKTYQFSGGSEGGWASGLVQARDGYLYGTTDEGGAGNRGTIFRIGTNGGFTLLASFPSASIGEFPDGASPQSGLAEASGGGLYGSTTYGGLGAGTIFQLGTNGSFTILYSFTNVNDGSGPSALTLAADGYLYGTTPTSGPSGKGTIFKITTNGALTSLYSFSGTIDGGIPLHGVILAGNGDLYGTTSSGGTANSGTIFQFSTNATFTLVYAFTNGLDGTDPVGLVQGSDGNLYGMASSGGIGSNGTIFQISASSALNVLHSFTGGTDGGQPSGPSLIATNGYLYGTTVQGGAASGRAGTVFRMTPSGTFTTLYSFTGIDGNEPTGLALGSDGNLYGTTVNGGIYNGGAIFQIATNGTFSVIYSFQEASDGGWPIGSIVSAADGNIYGTAEVGGGILGGFGTLFRIVITPTNAPIPALQFPALSAGNLNFGFTAAAGQSYFLQETTNLATTNWTFFTNLVGAGTFVQLSVPATNPAQFFRLREP